MSSQHAVPRLSAGLPGPTAHGTRAVQNDQQRTSRPHRVHLLRWPEQAAEVERYRLRRMPRLLVVAPGARPPATLDPLEDWVREPVDDGELQARWEILRARAVPRAPVVDSQDVLHYAGRRLPLAAGEAELVRLLLESYRSVVRREELAQRLWPDSDARRRNALDVRVLRARRRLEPLGLIIRTVWRRGYLLDADLGGDAG
ncbi:helix-turn-helix domain-containing protein [Streptomyces sp. ISL-22]|uniref:helix-turn-helix domain-containing protein n=1 Tax=unclassified Streptomyces TaxID=2593676 RepID=UPI001BE8854D|nr:MULTISPECIES: helix-turn-helix domain-containing protein [unclassified Streptomyces]MBT2418878.1 helix-turn-helix domain-containing protein [Streptomyces sp. ISL-24]MBT2435689.1 helix-turn-helix domain-containing protein [Streptomyces sp. ISL-22]